MQSFALDCDLLLSDEAGQLPIARPPQQSGCQSRMPGPLRRKFLEVCADFQSLTTIRHFQAEGCAVFLPLRPPPGGRRLAAARTGTSDCAGFAPNHKPEAVCHEPRFPSRPATLPRPPFCPLPRSGLFFPAAALVKKKTKPETARKGKTMKLEDIKNKTKDAVDYPVQSLESGHSEVLTQYLGAMARFHTYSFGNVMLIARQNPTPAMLPGFARGTRLAASSNAGKRHSHSGSHGRQEAHPERRCGADRGCQGNRVHPVWIPRSVRVRQIIS